MHEWFLAGLEHALIRFSGTRLPGVCRLPLELLEAALQQFRRGDVHRLAATRTVYPEQLHQFLVQDDLKKAFVFILKARTAPALRIP